MSGAVQTEEATVAAEVAELRARVRALEMRLDRIERGSSVAVSEEEREPSVPVRAASGGIDTEVAAARIFRRVAVLCFVLLGALILRVLTQQKILGAGFGTILGFTYAACLVVLSMMPGRLGKFAR